MNMDMDCPFQEAEKREKGRSIPAAPLFLLSPLPFIMTFYNDFAAHFSAKTGCRASFITGHETSIHKESRPISYI